MPGRVHGRRAARDGRQQRKTRALRAAFYLPGYKEDKGGKERYADSGERLTRLFTMQKTGETTLREYATDASVNPNPARRE